MSDISNRESLREEYLEGCKYLLKEHNMLNTSEIKHYYNNLSFENMDDTLLSIAFKTLSKEVFILLKYEHKLPH
jgi:hypothetical protein